MFTLIGFIITVYMCIGWSRSSLFTMVLSMTRVIVFSYHLILLIIQLSPSAAVAGSTHLRFTACCTFFYRYQSCDAEAWVLLRMTCRPDHGFSNRQTPVGAAVRCSGLQHVSLRPHCGMTWNTFVRVFKWKQLKILNFLII